MPNWCANKLTVTGPAADVQAFKTKAVGHSPWSKPEDRESEVLNFHSLKPIPEDVLAAGYAEAGINWERQNWGCKWGAQDSTILDEREGKIQYEFLSAWTPPIECFQTVAVQWPALSFVLEYEEPGMAFKGLAKFEGEKNEDHCIAL